MKKIYPTIRLSYSQWLITISLILCLLITVTHSFGQVTASDFVTTWKTDNAGTTGSNQILIPASGEYTVYYESIPAGLSGTLPETGTFTDNQTLTFPVAGTYRVAIKPTGATPFHQIQFLEISDQKKILTIEQWGTTAWSSMEFAYQNCENLTTLPETDVPLLSNVTSMGFAFAYCSSLTGSSNMDSWDVSNVTTMQAMFVGAGAFNQPIGNWDVSNVLSMTEMFYGAAAFNQPIGGWNVGNVTRMSNMFDQATSFNQPLGNWNVSSVTVMDDMFNEATSFNQPLSSWNVGSVVNMTDMFNGATAFNQPVNTWNVSNVTRMQNMFNNATTFNQPLSNWTFAVTARMNNMLGGSGMDCGNYNTTLIGWAANPATPDGRSLGVSGLTFGPPAASAHDVLITNKGWGITGDSFDASCTSLISSSDFVTTWQTDGAGGSGNDQILIPAFGEYKVYYESIPAGISGTLPETGTFTDNQTLTFPGAGTYRVAIKPTGAIPFHQISFDLAGDNGKILTVEQWGTTIWSAMSFSSCFMLTTLPETDLPVLSNVTSLELAFGGCTAFTGSSNMNDWDVSNVSNMRAMFERTTNFNQPIGSWNVSNVTSMESMFEQAEAFNQPIGGWNVSNVTTMFRMFRRTTSFNQPLGNWNVGSVTNMREMFYQAPLFNQPISSWNVGNVLTMNSMFRSATAFNQSVNNWNVTSVTDMQGIFRDASAFNQPLDRWTFNSNVTLSTMLNYTALDCSNYNTTLVGWAANPATPTPAGRNFGAIGRVYGPPAVDARNDLINNKNWVFTGDSFDAGCTSLPVTLVSFDATIKELSALLSWSTAEETNSDRFEIQRSMDAKKWEIIGAVLSIGESKTLQTYRFSDTAPLDGINYYRLRMVDRGADPKDKPFAYSRIQSVEFAVNPALSLYPNPASDRLLIDNYEKVKQVLLFNAAGVKLLESKNVTAKGIDVSKLSPGLHMVKMVFSDGRFQTSKLVISR